MPRLLQPLRAQKIMPGSALADCGQREELKCSSSLELQRLWPSCSRHCRHPLNPMIPTIIHSACKAEITACRGCVSSQATRSVRRRPREHSPIVARIPDSRSHSLCKTRDLTGKAHDIIGTADDITGRGDPAARFNNGTVIPGMNAIAFTREVRASWRASKDGHMHDAEHHPSRHVEDDAHLRMTLRF
jgi:hypothetical protein